MTDLSKIFPGEAMLQRQIKTAFEEKGRRDSYLRRNGMELLNAYLYAVVEEMPDIFELKAEPGVGMTLRAHDCHAFNIIPQNTDADGRWNEILVEQVFKGEDSSEDIIENATHPEIQGGLIFALSCWCEAQCPRSMCTDFALADGHAQRKVRLKNIDWVHRNRFGPFMS